MSRPTSNCRRLYISEKPTPRRARVHLSLSQLKERLRITRSCTFRLVCLMPNGSLASLAMIWCKFTLGLVSFNSARMIWMNQESHLSITLNLRLETKESGLHCALWSHNMLFSAEEEVLADKSLWKKLTDLILQKTNGHRCHTWTKLDFYIQVAP